MEQPTLPRSWNVSFFPTQSPAQSDPHKQVTDKLPYKNFDVTVKTPSRNAYFSEQSSLLLTIENGMTPLIVYPPSMTLFGRIGGGKADMTVIDLAAYNGREKGVSRLHAVLHRSPGLLQIEDLSSRNGTYVNGHRVIPHFLQVLNDGDELRLGGLIINIKFQ